jgi:membrane fusion protein (multidrug efflux system)
MPARITIDGAGTDNVFDGMVDLVSPQADSQSFTFTVRVLLPPSVMAEAGDRLKPGMFARVRVQVGGEREAVVIPEAAIANPRDNGGTVFVFSQGRVSEREVRLGTVTEGRREILSGLNAGEAVVLNPEASLKEGSRVIPEQ